MDDWKSDDLIVQVCVLIYFVFRNSMLSIKLKYRTDIRLLANSQQFSLSMRQNWTVNTNISLLPIITCSVPITK